MCLLTGQKRDSKWYLQNIYEGVDRGGRGYGDKGCGIGGGGCGIGGGGSGERG